MEEDIEKALNNLWNSLDDEFFNLTYSQEQMQEDIRLILNRYNYLDSKNENLINKYKEQEKMIDFMIDWIRERSIYGVDSHEKLKDYFKKKVRDENENPR